MELLLSANPKGLHPQDGWLLSFLECSSGRPVNFYMGPHQFPLSAPVHITWSTSAYLGGCQMGMQQTGPRKASLDKWKSITSKQTSFSLQSIISFPHAGERQNQINNYSAQSLNCYRRFISFLVAYNAFSHLQSQKNQSDFINLCTLWYSRGAYFTPMCDTYSIKPRIFSIIVSVSWIT